MAAAMDHPLLKDRLASSIDMDGPAVGVAARYLPALYLGLQHTARRGLSDDLIAIAWVNGAVLVCMKYNGRDSAPACVLGRAAARPVRRRRALAHCSEGRRHVAGGAAGGARMHPSRRVQIRVGLRHDGGSR